MYRFCSLEEKLKERLQIPVTKANPDKEIRALKTAPKPANHDPASDDEINVSCIRTYVG